MYIQKRNNLCSIVLISILLTAFFSGCGILPEEEEAMAPPLVKAKREEYQLYKATRKDITKYVKGIGAFEPLEKQDLFFTESGKRIKSIDVKYGQMVKKGDVVIKSNNDDLESRIKLQNISVEKLEFQLSQLRGEYNQYMSLAADDRPAPKDMKELEGRIKLMQLDLEAARIQMNDLIKEQNGSVLVAPIDGKVIFIDDVKEGDTAEPYKPIITIADPGKLQIYYQSSNLRAVKTGMKAELTFDKKPYNGEVVLSPYDAPPSSGKKYEDAIIVKPDTVIEGARLGGTVDIAIPIESHKNAVVIPKKGLQRAFGTAVVRVMEGDSKKEFDVEVGIETDTEVEIVSGLAEGQMVIIN